jgi:hypothetical protein
MAYVWPNNLCAEVLCFDTAIADYLPGRSGLHNSKEMKHCHSMDMIFRSTAVGLRLNYMDLHIEHGS